MTSIVVWLWRHVRKPDYDTRRTKAKGELRAILTSVQLVRLLLISVRCTIPFFTAKHKEGVIF